MKVAVAGGTGLVGRYVVQSLERGGHEPVVLARSRGVDLVSGAGLAGALAGAEAVVDVTNKETLHRGRARAFFDAVTSHLLAEGARAGVRHHVALSIVGIDRVDSGYYAAKLHQEELVRNGTLPGTVLRATQFHEFAGQLLGRARGPIAVVPRMQVQPVAAVEVAERLVELATRPPAGPVPDLAGPQVHELVDLARQVSAREGGRRRRVVGVRLPGAAGRAMAGGALLPVGSHLTGTTTFAEWLRG